jgi:hypothetical protein
MAAKAWFDSAGSVARCRPGKAAARTVVVVWACLLAGCGDDVPEPHGPDVAASERLAAEVRFVDLPEIPYRIGETQLVSSPARLFYALQPATVDPTEAPIFVVGAGGPAASAMFVLGYIGGAYAATTEPDGTIAVAPSPHALTELGNVLYIDSRNAGFSYPTLEDPALREQRAGELAVRNYNVYRDAADVLHVLLEVLEQHPALADNPVYILTESYGGLRATVMLNLLLFGADYASETRPLFAPVLHERIQHFCVTRFDDATPPPEVVARQFRGQILLQPTLAGGRQSAAAGALFEQPGSVLEQLGADAGSDYVPCRLQETECDPYDNAHAFLGSIDRSPYDYRQPAAWLAEHIAATEVVATHHAWLAQLAGVDTATLDATFGATRDGAYRFADPAHGERTPRGDLEAHFGTLSLWDAHFVALHRESLPVFLSAAARELRVDPDHESFGDLFLENLRYISTFISRAEYDLVVYSPALIPALESYPQVSRAWLESAAAADLIRVAYADGSTRAIFSPRYLDSSHSVCCDEAGKLRDDVAGFLQWQPP